MKDNIQYRILAAVISTVLAILALLYFWDKFFFDEPMFWLLLLIPAMGLFYIFFDSKNHKRIRTSSVKNFAAVPESNLIKWKSITFITFSMACIAIILCIARPQSKTEFEDITEEGIDIVMAMDLSTSMLSKDFQVNRLESSKDVAVDFVKGRKSDRIGIVVYENESYTAVPLTTDTAVIINTIKELKTGTFEGGTAIGLGLATAVNRLIESEAKSKIIFLLTDGENNSGNINPVDAAELAKTFDIRVYTIGVGKKGKALSPVRMRRNGTFDYDWMDVNIDEKVLKEIAAITGGEYFRATDKNSLENVYKKIDELEKSKIIVSRYSKKTEKYYLFGLAAIGFILLTFLLSKTLFKTSP